MTNKEYVLDCLMDGSEAEKQIVEFFRFLQIEISVEEIRFLIQELVNEGLIFQDNKWVNELGESPFSISLKGREVWSKIKTKK
ncbi:MAG: hypothetical protein PHW40_01045 [Candidatus Izemoplasmatales bacterium]|jgi:hypothetical protein|nr:hypothetical protein [Candidatus Izemoplasmatales bacterium]MDD5292880.1 hypothetical protein [Candidatus Izemoplasmatales bacterium]